MKLGIELKYVLVVTKVWKCESAEEKILAWFSWLLRFKIVYARQNTFKKVCGILKNVFSSQKYIIFWSQKEILFILEICFQGNAIILSLL